MAGTTNFVQVNPGSQNQLNDSGYQANALTTGGAAVNAECPSAWFNKFAYQQSTFTTAFAAMLAAKNFSPADTSLATLTTLLANVLTTFDIPDLMSVVAFSATPAFNAAASSGIQMTLTGDITSSTISGVLPGQILTFIFIQDATGGRTVSWPSSFVGAVQPNPAANAVSVLQFTADNTGIPRSTIPQIAVNDVTVSRALSTVYQNLTGAPLTVSVISEHGSTGATISLYIGSTSSPASLVAQTSVTPATSSPASMTTTAQVPAGYYYQASGSATLQNWLETSYV